jgi:hypothetical protein
VILPGSAADDLEASDRLAIADFDGDGAADLAIGAPGGDGGEGQRTDSGVVYVISSADLHNDVDPDESALLTVSGATAGDNLGFSVAAGDLNADGVDDLIAGAIGSNSLDNLRTDMGEVFVFFGGKGLSGERDLLDSEHDLVLRPAEGFSHLGTSLAAGDVDGDGVDDLVAGAPFAGRQPGSPVGSPRTTVGEVYVVLGSADLGGTLEVTNGEVDALLSGEAEFDQFGQSVAVHDVNGDGTGDILVGSPGDDSSGQDAGSMFAFPGSEDLGGRLDSSGADAAWHGSAPGARFGDLVLGLEGRVASASPTAGAPECVGCGFVQLFEGQDQSPVAGYTGATSGEFFPSALAAWPQDDGSRLLMGAPAANDEGGIAYLADAGADNMIDLSDSASGVAAFTGVPGERLGSAFAAFPPEGDATRFAVLAAGSPAAGDIPPVVYLVMSAP